MAFCGNCGSQVQDGAKFCPSCGRTMDAPQQAQQNQQPQYDQQNYQQQQYNPNYQQQPQYDQNYQQQQYYQQQDQYYQPPVVPGAPPQSSIQDAQNNKGMAVIAYIIFFIPFLTGAHKTSPFVKYHTNQGTVLFLACIAFSIANMILTGLLTALFLRASTWGLWTALTTILSLLWIVPTVLCVIGIINAVNGRMKPLPIIGKFTLVK